MNIESWQEKYEHVFKPFFDLTTDLEHNTKTFKYPNAAILAKKICEFFIYRRENLFNLSAIALCVHLGITTMTFRNMKNYSEDFKNLIEVSMSCIEDFWLDTLGQSENAARFILSGMAGYTVVEKTIIESDSFTINIKNPNGETN